MAIFYQPLTQEGITYLDPEESRHCIKVLRKSVGDTIHIADGAGRLHTARIEDINPKKCSFNIIKTQEEPPHKYYIHLAIAPTKNTDRIEWLVEKAVEIGVHELSFIICANSERKHFKTDRIKKKAIGAMKQSLKATLPKINESIALKQFLKHSYEGEKYIAYVDFGNPTQLFTTAGKNLKYHVLIGPEGDFTNEEVLLAGDRGFTKIGLGSSRLRTETAALAACHTLNLINQ